MKSYRKKKKKFKNCLITLCILLLVLEVVCKKTQNEHWWKSVRIWGFSGLYIPISRLNTERYGVSFHIQSDFHAVETKQGSVLKLVQEYGFWNFFLNLELKQVFFVLKNCLLKLTQISLITFIETLYLFFTF